MNRILAGIVLASLILFSTSSTAKTGNELYAQLTSSDSREKLQGLEYIEGVEDESDHYAADLGKNGKLLHPHVCTVGMTITFGQIIDIVVKYMASHPEIRHLNANVLVLNAMVQAFPCAQNPDN